MLNAEGRVDNRLVVRVDPIEFGKISRIHVLQDHDRVAVGRRQLDFGSRENRIEVLGHPRIFLYNIGDTHQQQQQQQKIMKGKKKEKIK